MGSKITELVHVRQKFDWDCGIACVQMFLQKCLGQKCDDPAVYLICKSMGVGESVWTIDLANLLLYFKIDCDFYTITCGVNSSYKNTAYYKLGFDGDETRVNELFKQAKEIGLKIIKRSLSIEDITNKLDDGYVAIVLVNSYLLMCHESEPSYPHDSLSFTMYPYELSHPTNKEQESPYVGHYIVVCGYDTNAGVFFYKDPSTSDILCNIQIARFDLARKSYGTDEDIIFINMTINL